MVKISKISLKWTDRGEAKYKQRWKWTDGLEISLHRKEREET